MLATPARRQGCDCNIPSALDEKYVPGYYFLLYFFSIAPLVATRSYFTLQVTSGLREATNYNAVGNQFGFSLILVRKVLVLCASVS